MGLLDEFIPRNLRDRECCAVNQGRNLVWLEQSIRIAFALIGKKVPRLSPTIKENEVIIPRDSLVGS